jgi:dihydroflavonol-4-reductase
MRVFVTGGTGFVGANVVRALLERGYSVRCLIRDSSPRLCVEGLDVEFVQASLSDVDALAHAMEGCGAVQHVAGTYDSSPKGQERMRFIHVDATRNLMEAALKAGAERFVVCSSSVTVGWGTLEKPGDEQTPISNLDDVYGVGTALRAYYDSKVASEDLAKTYAAQGLGAVVVNPDYVIGEWDVKPTSGAMIVNISKHWIPVYPKGGKCFIGARDCADGHVLAMESGVPGRRYLLGLENHSYLSFMTTIAEVVGRRPPAFPIPSLVTQAAGLAGRVVARLDPHKATALDAQVLRSMQEERYRSGKLAIEELGLPHTPLDVCIERAFRWFRDHGYC